MTDSSDTTDLKQLSIAERLRLIEELWDSLEGDVDALLLSDWQRAEIDKRLDALDRGTSVGAPWDEVRRRITGKP
jgi:putative addiction module component (TIGR02574 family)